MEKILKKSKEYEYIRDSRDQAYNAVVDAIVIVKKFIIDNKLIVYGGTSLDYALRMKGDQIYPDSTLSFPDLDFYSPDNVEHSYQLADILYIAGHKSARAVRAIYVRTMKVDVIDGHFVADITFCPKEVFEKLPTLEYNGMRIIHPDFQRIDMHSALCHPYDNPPSEVIFDRWKKDVERFNIMNKYYPVAAEAAILQLKPITISANYHKYTANGYFAYAIILRHFIDLIGQLKLQKPPELSIPSPPLEIKDDSIIFNTFDRMVDITHFDADKCAEELNLAGQKQYEPYMSAIPDTITGVIDDVNVKIYSSKNRLVSANNVKIGETMFKTVNIQYLLRHFIAHAHISEGKTRNTYMQHYISLLKMIGFIEEKITDKSFGVISDEIIEILKQSPLFLSTYTYGNENNSLAYLVLLNGLLHELGRVEQWKLPWNYYPEKSLPKRLPHPAFDPKESEFFQEAGREIKEH